MSTLLKYLLSAKGERGLLGKIGQWRLRISQVVDDLVATQAAAAVHTAGGINFYEVFGTALTGPFTLDTWFTLAPAIFTAGDLSADLAQSGNHSLQYTGAAKLLTIRAGVSLSTTAFISREDYELGIFRNGVLIPGSSADLQSLVAQDGAVMAGHATTQISVILQTGDILDIRLRERATGDSATSLSSAYLVIAE